MAHSSGPRVLEKEGGVVNKTQADTVFNKRRMRKGFCEDISRHVACRTVVKRNDVIFNMLSDKVILDINMLGSRMEFGILGQCDRSLIVHPNLPHLFQVPNSPKLFEL